MINHACVANASATPIDGHQRIRTIRDIGAGEEITVRYVNPLLPYADRQRRLAPYGINCAESGCRLCMDQSKHGDDCDTSRRLHSIAQLIAMKDLTRRRESFAKNSPQQLVRIMVVGSTAATSLGLINEHRRCCQAALPIRAHLFDPKSSTAKQAAATFVALAKQTFELTELVYGPSHTTARAKAMADGFQAKGLTAQRAKSLADM